MDFSRLQGYQGYKRGMQGQDSQGYKAIKATGGVCRDEFLKATRLSRLLKGDAGICFSRLQGYQGYRRGTQGWVFKATRLSRLLGGMQGWICQGYQGYRRVAQG